MLDNTENNTNKVEESFNFFPDTINLGESVTNEVDEVLKDAGNAYSNGILIALDGALDGAPDGALNDDQNDGNTLITGDKEEKEVLEEELGVLNLFLDTDKGNSFIHL